MDYTSITVALGLALELIVLFFYSLYAYAEALFKSIFPQSPKSLAQDVILVTGSANGIGREICLQLADSGAKIVCWDIEKKRNDSLGEELKKVGAKVFTYEIDVSDRNQVETVMSKVRRDVGEVTIVINNAGIMPCHKFLSHNPRELERSFQVNVFAHFWILREVLPKMIERDSGHIVTLCSAAGLIPTRNLVPYCGTKFAVHGYIEALKEEFRHYAKKPNINFTTIYPYVCNTDLVKNVNCSTRFPSLIPLTDPEIAAKKIIDGFRRNKQYVYIPGVIQLVGGLTSVLTPKVLAASADIFECYVEPDN